MKLRELTDLYVHAKDRLEAERGPPKRQKAIEGAPLSQELIRDGAICSFLMGAIFALVAFLGPPLHEAYDVTEPPTFVKPDWYLLWSLGPIFLAKWPIPNPLSGVDVLPEWLTFDPLIDTSFLGTILVNVAFVALMVVPFVAGRGKSRRPIESPANVGWGVFGLAFIWWMSLVGIADVIFAFEVEAAGGSLGWLLETGFTPTPSELIDLLGVVTMVYSLAPAFLIYWVIKRHRPRYESKLNANYFKVR